MTVYINNVQGELLTICYEIFIKIIRAFRPRELTTLELTAHKYGHKHYDNTAKFYFSFEYYDK